MYHGHELLAQLHKQLHMYEVSRNSYDFQTKVLLGNS